MFSEVRCLGCHPYLLCLLLCHPSSLTTSQSTRAVSGAKELMMLIFPIPPVFPSPALSPVEAALVLLPAQIPQFQIRGHPSLVGSSNSAVGAIAVTPSPASLVLWTMPPQFPSLPHSQPCSQPNVFPCLFSPASVLPTCLFRTSRHSLFSSCR